MLGVRRLLPSGIVKQTTILSSGAFSWCCNSKKTFLYEKLLNKNQFKKKIFKKIRNFFFNYKKIFIEKELIYILKVTHHKFYLKNFVLVIAYE